MSHVDKTEEESFEIFLSSIVYIGKGTRSDRPFNHLTEARKKVTEYKLCCTLNPRCLTQIQCWVLFKGFTVGIQILDTQNRIQPKSALVRVEIFGLVTRS